MSTAENGSETGEDLKAQVEALRVEVARLQNAQRRAIRWDWLFHPLAVLAASLGVTLAFAGYIIVDQDLSGAQGRHSFYLFYMVPLAAPLTAFAMERASRLFQPRPLQWLVDLGVIGLGLVRAMIMIPGISGHALFLAYALLTCRMRVAKALALAVLVQVAYLKIFVWNDLTLLGGYTIYWNYNTVKIQTQFHPYNRDILCEVLATGKERKVNEFPRTLVGGVSLPRLIIGSNWFLGYSHTSLAKDRFIKDLQTRERIAKILAVFLENGIDAVMAPPSKLLEEAILDAEDQTGQQMIRILTPIFNIAPGGDAESEPGPMFDLCKTLNATFCLPHQCVTDALLDRREGKIRELDQYTKLIRERGMIPGLSTHMPETPIYADRQGADVETYIQIYNAAGFLMQVEADWVQRIIANAQKPVMTIKPLAAGRLLPIVGMAFAWSTIRDQDMVTIGTTTPDEAREIIDISLDLLAHQMPEVELQKTRSKRSLM